MYALMYVFIHAHACMQTTIHKITLVH